MYILIGRTQGPLFSDLSCSWFFYIRVIMWWELWLLFSFHLELGGLWNHCSWFSFGGVIVDSQAYEFIKPEKMKPQDRWGHHCGVGWARLGGAVELVGDTWEDGEPCCQMTGELGGWSLSHWISSAQQEGVVCSCRHYLMQGSPLKQLLLF